MMVGNMWKRRRISRSKGRRMIDYMMLIFYIELILLISQVRNIFCVSIEYNGWVKRNKFCFYNISSSSNNYPRKQDNKLNQFALHCGIQNEFSRYMKHSLLLPSISLGLASFCTYYFAHNMKTYGGRLPRLLS